MWFQDLFNYDFRRTEMCIIPYGTQMGEISFCAYNTGVGWRNVIEKMKANATVAEWYRTQGRHPVYAKNQDLPLPASRRRDRAAGAAQAAARGGVMHAGGWSIDVMQIRVRAVRRRPRARRRGPRPSRSRERRAVA